jgi:hypothetical protein
MTQSEIESANFRIVMQCLNQLRYQQRAPKHDYNLHVYIRDRQIPLHSVAYHFLQRKLLFGIG